MPFGRNMGRSICKNLRKYLNSKYSQKLLDHVKLFAEDALNTASNKVIQKTAEANGDLIGNKIADRITKVSPQNNFTTELLGNSYQ